MKIYNSIDEFNQIKENLSNLVYVPTMGNLHYGHAALIDAAKRFDQEVIATIYINKLQFNDKNDYLILLSEGRLVNLGNATGHPSRIMDGSFANQVLAQMYLFDAKFADLPLNEKLSNITVDVLPKKLDEEVAAGMVKGFGGVLTTMTDEQADYIGVSKVGPYKPEVYRY